ncbi:GNAT family N-acetyltransferase, partial [Listeria booriae]
FKLHRMEAKVDPRNEASISLLQKLGFQEEGLLRDYEKIGTEFQNLKLFSWLNK